MAKASVATGRLTSFYGEMTSLERVMASLRRDGVDVEHLRASDVYERDLDCQNLGGVGMLEVIAAAVAELSVPGIDDHVLDVGCGMGGPGRFLVDSFGCSVTGVDLLPLRVQSAEELTSRTGLSERIAYRVADATALPFGGAEFAQVWMLDVGIHVRDKSALFGEVARVLRPGGVMVMHDQVGPLPEAMRPVTRLAPFIAPSLPQLIRYIEASGLRLMAWRDSTAHVVAYFERIRDRYFPPGAPPDDEARPWRKWIRMTTDAYLTSLGGLGGRTGILLAVRRPDG